MKSRFSDGGISNAEARGGTLGDFVGSSPRGRLLVDIVPYWLLVVGCLLEKLRLEEKVRGS